MAKDTLYRNNGVVIAKPNTNSRNQSLGIYYKGEFVIMMPLVVIDALIETNTIETFTETLDYTLRNAKKREFERGADTIRDGFRELMKVPSAPDLDRLGNDISNLEDKVRDIE